MRRNVRTLRTSYVKCQPLYRFAVGPAYGGWRIAERARARRRRAPPPPPTAGRRPPPSLRSHLLRMAAAATVAPADARCQLLPTPESGCSRPLIAAA
jgi:hypothetical protein